MRRKITRNWTVLFALALALCAQQPARAAVPGEISFQGFLTDGSGVPVNGTVSMTFRIYDAAAAGTELWSETQTVTPDEGRYAVLLGEVTPLTGLAFDLEYWLSVEVQTDGEMTPRYKIATSPFAFTARNAENAERADDADMLGGLLPADYAATMHAHDGADITSGIVSDPYIDALIARDSEIFPAVLAGDGAGSLLDADLLDGLDSMAFWQIGGNTGLIDGTNNLFGTTDNVALNIIVNGARALRIEPTPLAADAPNIIGGHPANTVTAGRVGATISGGGFNDGVWLRENRITANYGTIGGGFNNTSSGWSSTVGGGYGNVASGNSAFIGGGSSNTASENYSIVSGGNSNVAGGVGATVGGGEYNLAQADFATIAGGGPAETGVPFTTNNRVYDSYGTIGGGGENRAGSDDFDETNATFATVGGGYSNKASGYIATVGGGIDNTASGNTTSIGGGGNNVASVIMATIGGGYGNTADGIAATIGGGRRNLASADYATIAGGGPSDLTSTATRDATNNRVFDDYGTIGGGGYNRAGSDDGNTTNATYATVGGGRNNMASGDASTVGGGWNNSASGVRSTVGGGGDNTASDFAATVGGGAGNSADAVGSFVGGGLDNTASIWFATVSGGENNMASNWYATVGGGNGNTASGWDSFVGGGEYNFAQARYATIAGGGPWDLTNTTTKMNTNNRVFDAYGTVGGGGYNRVGSDDADPTNSWYATVGGGAINKALAMYSTIGGGWQNMASMNYATVSGGYSNTASGIAATVGGGDSNTASGQWSTIGGGLFNRAINSRSTVGGGNANTASGINATVGGGDTNTASGIQATVGGGDSNWAGGLGATVSGGRYNTASAGATVGGGEGNLAQANYATIAGGGPSDGLNGVNVNIVYDDWGTIGGGGNNRAGSDDGDTTSVRYATVGGGRVNTASDSYATVGGGQVNLASGWESTVAGGASNTASGFSATVPGGRSNTAAGDYSFAAGYDNTASGSRATVPGGWNNTAAGDYSFAAGRQAKIDALHDGTFLWSDDTVSDFTSAAANEFAARATGGFRFVTAVNAGGAPTAGIGFLSGTDTLATIGAGPFELYVNNERALRIEPTASADAPNIIAGHSANTVSVGVVGATISGGGRNLLENQVTANYGTVGGGERNRVSGWQATVPGGSWNTAAGEYSFAAGFSAIANHNGTFVWADDTKSFFTSLAANEFAARATGGVRFVTAVDGGGNPTAGVSLGSGDTSWSAISDRNKKKDFQPVAGESILERLRSMPITTWRYIWERSESVPHIGPVAQDFKALFYPGRDDKTISTLEFDGVELAAIQALIKRTEKLAIENKQLKQESARLKQVNGALKKRLERVEEALGVQAP